jgi:hypothetical protein
MVGHMTTVKILPAEMNALKMSNAKMVTHVGAVGAFLKNAPARSGLIMR